MKFEPYLSLDTAPDEFPVFSIRVSHGEMSVDFYGLTEEEISEFIKDIQDQIVLYLSVNAKLQSLHRKANENV